MSFYLQHPTCWRPFHIISVPGRTERDQDEERSEEREKGETGREEKRLNGKGKEGGGERRAEASRG